MLQGFDPFFTETAGRTVPLWFPARLPSALLSYALDIACAVNTATDVVASATVAVAPSGTGELTLSAFTGSGYELIVTPTGGQPGRVYRYLFLATMTNGNVYEFLVQQETRKSLPSDFPQVAPVAGYGAPMSCTTFGPALLEATGLVAQGTGQTSALLLPAYFNEIASASPGGFVLNPFTPDGRTVVVQDDDPTNNAQVWPPLGAQINALGVNEPFIVGSLGGRINFTPSAGATQWIAG
jgi:hypothetical protein